MQLKAQRIDASDMQRQAATHSSIPPLPNQVQKLLLHHLLTALHVKDVDAAASQAGQNVLIHSTHEVVGDIEGLQVLHP